LILTVLIRTIAEGSQLSRGLTRRTIIRNLWSIMEILQVISIQRWKKF